MNGSVGVVIYVSIIMGAISYVIYTGLKARKENDEYKAEKKARKKARKKEKKRLKSLAAG